mgnify:CR=1 FL=1
MITAASSVDFTGNKPEGNYFEAVLQSRNPM